MARFGKKKLLGTLVIVLAVVLGGYIVKKATAPQPVASADSTGGHSDTLQVADADTSAADKDDKDKEGEDEKKEPDPVPVEIATVSPRPISSFYQTTATLEPEKAVDILAKTAGEVRELLVEEGDVVESGRVLCMLEDDSQRIEVEEARINRDQQEREFARIESMHTENLISDKEYSDAKHLYEVAVNKLEAAQLRLEHTLVRAPFSGVITKRLIDLGENVSVGARLFEIVDTTPLLIRMYLPESEMRDIHVGQDVTITPDSHPDRRLIGTIVRIAPEVDTRTGTVKVTAEASGDAMPGSFARIKIVTDTRKGSLTIPRRGIISDAGELFSYVVEADTVRKSRVRIGYQDEDYAEVLSGVELGDSVVVVGTGGLRTGTKVKVLESRMQEVLSKKESELVDSTSN